MIENKVSLKGLSGILNKIAQRLKTPEERKLIDAQAKTEESKANQIKQESFVRCLKDISKKHSLDLGNIQKAIGLYKSIGFSEDKIQKIIGPKIDKLLETCKDLDTLKQLVNDDVILNAEVRQIEPPKEKKNKEK